MSNIKHKLASGPDVEELNKQFEEKAFDKWSKFLMKQNKQKKYIEKVEKDTKAIKSM